MACHYPIKVRPGTRWVTVGCGNCLGCRADQARDWSIRIMHETQMHDVSWFLTLTYGEEFLPENGSLCPEDLRGFFKALRRQRPEESFSYYACGEYGERSERPHYHAVLFGVDFLDRDFLRHSGSGPVWRSGCLEDAWPFGFSEFGTVTPGAASYVAGYVRKKVQERAREKEYQRVDPSTGEIVQIEPVFSRMSLRPAIGRRWIEVFWPEVYPRDFVVMDGKEYRPPRYYDKWMAENHPEVLEEVKEKRIERCVVPDEYDLHGKETRALKLQELYQQRDGI